MAETYLGSASALLNCTGDEETCAPCSLRRIITHARDDRTLPLIQALEAAIDRVQPSAQDIGMVAARLLEMVVKGCPGGLGMARAALLLAESKAPARRPAEARFDA